MPQFGEQAEANARTYSPLRRNMTYCPPDPPTLERVPTGVAGLDTVLRGGLLRGGIFIVQGSPGAGKTILGNQICFNHIAEGGRALYVTLLAENHTRMLLHIGQLAFL